jgi:V/A-type H+-transporting ATPase subunit A
MMAYRGRCGAEKPSGRFLRRGCRRALDTQKKWHFGPAIKEGDPIAPGTAFGIITETDSIVHRLIFDSLVPACTAATVAPEGDYTISATLVKSSDGKEYTAMSYWPVRTPRTFKEKQVTHEPLVTGLRVIDVLFPIAKGGSAAVPGGFGTGKTMTQHAIAKWCDADIIVYIGCGERGNEMTEVLTEFPTLIDPRTGRSLMEARPHREHLEHAVAAREVSIYRNYNR